MITSVVRRFGITLVLALLLLPWPAGAAHAGSPIVIAGQIGGSTRAVAVAGSRAFLGVGPRVLVFDVSDFDHPVLLGQSPVLGGIVEALTAREDYVYVAAGTAGLRILSLADPAHPVEVGSYWTTAPLTALAVLGDLVLIGDELPGPDPRGRLRILNVANPALPVQVGTASLTGSASALTVEGSYAYVADKGVWFDGQVRGAGLRVFDVSNPAVPARVGSVDDFFANALEASGRYLYAAAGFGGLRVYDVLDPTRPTFAGQWSQDQFQAFDVALMGSTAYLVGGWPGMVVLDVSRPAAITARNRQTPGSYQVSVAAGAGRVYVAAEYGLGLQIYHSPDPAGTHPAGKYAGRGWAGDVAMQNDLAYVATGGNSLRIVDMAAPDVPVDAGYLLYGPHRYWTDGIAVAGDYAYIAQAGEGLRVLNVTNPQQPVPAGALQTAGNASGVAAAGTTAYLADGTAGLRIISAVDPTQPVELASLDTPGMALGVTVAGGLAYVADANKGLRIIEVAKPSVMHEVGAYDTPGFSIRVAVAGRYAYVADYDALVILDIEEPSVPVLAARLPLDGVAQDVAVSDGRAYVAAGEAGLYVVDVGNPAAPFLLIQLGTPGLAGAVRVVGQTICIADGPGGLLTMDIERQRTYLPWLARP